MGLIVGVQANGALIGKINLLGIQMDTTADATWLPGLLAAVSGMIGICIVPLINKKLGKENLHRLFYCNLPFQYGSMHILLAAS